MCAEDQPWIARRPIPKQHVELVFHEAGQRAFGRVADELAELRLGGGDFRILIVVRWFFGFFALRLGKLLLLHHVPHYFALAKKLTGGLLLDGELPGLVRRRIGHFEVVGRHFGVPINFRAFAITEELAVIGAKVSRLRPVERRGGKYLAGLRRHEPDLRPRPLGSQAVVEGSRRVGGLLVREEALHLQSEIVLALAQKAVGFLGKRISHALVEQRLLALQHELLVPQ